MFSYLDLDIDLGVIVFGFVFFNCKFFLRYIYSNKLMFFGLLKSFICRMGLEIYWVVSFWRKLSCL